MIEETHYGKRSFILSLVGLICTIFIFFFWFYLLGPLFIIIIFLFFGGWFSSILGIVFGFMQKRKGQTKLGKVGLILGIIGFILFTFYTYAFYILTKPTLYPI